MINQVKSKISDQINLSERGQTVGYINMYNYLYLRQEKEIAEKFNWFTLDGIALVVLTRLLGIKRVQRKSPDFSSYFRELFTELNIRRGSLLAIGGTPKDIQVFDQIIRDMFPHIKRLQFLSGYEEFDPDMIGMIRDLNPDTIILGMGTPKQELFALQLKKTGIESSVFCCGAFISQTANTEGEYFPKWISKLHLRWVYRIYKEPKLFRRYLLDYPKGLYTVVMDYATKPSIPKE